MLFLNSCPLFLLSLVLSLEISSSTFKILQFTDLHYGEDPVSDFHTSELQKRLLLQESPNIVVISGDMVSGYAWPWTSNWYAKYYNSYIEPMKLFNTPWALTLGNHDIEADLSGGEIMELDSKQPLSLSKSLKPSGISHTSNYYIIVTHQGKAELIIWCLDTGNRNHLEFGFDRVHEDQIEWIQRMQKKIFAENQNTLPGIIFMHIPPPEFMDIWENSLGNKYEDVSCPGNHTRYLINSLQNILAIAVGHDHFNDYSGKTDNIMLLYGRKTGFSGNGPEPYFNKGARVFEYYFKEKVLETWIRDEDGKLIVHHERNGRLGKQNICAESIDEGRSTYLVCGCIAVTGLALYLKKYWRNRENKPERFMI